MADLMAACEKSGELRHGKPRYPRQVLELLRAIREDLESPGPERLPSRESEILLHKLDALTGIVEKDYPRDDDEIKLGSDVYERVIELDATLKALRRHIIESDDYKEFLQCLKRIDRVLPSTDYDFKDLLQHITEDKPTAKIHSRLKESVEEFASGRFEECLNKAQKLNETLIENLKEYTRIVFRCRVESLGDCRQVVLKSGAEPDTSCRIECLVTYLLYVTRYLRNVVEHEDRKPKIPAWMDERREWLRRQSATARLMILCELHAALELQHLWQNEALEASAEIDMSAPGLKSPEST